MPTLVFVAGPNGSGKSTVASQASFRAALHTPEEPALIAINPDDVLVSLRSENPAMSQAELEGLAARASDKMLFDAICEGRGCLRETVLSTDRLLKDVQTAKARGFRFVLIFVLLRNPQLNVDRVHQRVKMGGHSVPEDRVRARWVRAMEMLPRFAEQADVLLLYDNSMVVAPNGADGPTLLIDATPDGVHISDEARILAVAHTGPLADMLTTMIAKFDR